MQHAVAHPLGLTARGRATWLPALAAWALGFAPVAVLALEGGGYDTISRSQFGIAVWWILALGCLVGVLRTDLPSKRAGVAVVALAALAAWTWLGVSGSESAERTLVEAARITTYLGVLLLALLAIDRRNAATVIVGIASGIALVTLIALLARLQPELLPANQTGDYLPIAQHRLNWPLNYWNGLATFVALGVPLFLTLATSHRMVAVRAVAAALIPAAALCLFLTVSRGGIAAALVGIVVLLVISPERLRLLGTLGIAAVASAILVAAAEQRSGVQQDLVGSAALGQGDQLTAVLVVVMLGAGLLQAGFATFLSLLTNPRATPRLTRRQLAGAFASVALIVLVAGLATGLPARTSDAWDTFKSPAAASEILGRYDPSRLGSLSSNGRYELWSAALQAAGKHPSTGTGSGTFEFWWLREGASFGTVNDAHSFYLELAAETGIAGLLLGLAFVLALFTAGWRALRLSTEARTALAAALAALAAFCFSAAVDWVWELAVIPITAMLLAGVAFGVGRGSGARESSGPPAAPAGHLDRGARADRAHRARPEQRDLDRGEPRKRASGQSQHGPRACDGCP